MKELRDATGLTQELLAALLQVSRETVGMGESGLRGYPASALLKLVALWTLVPASTEEKDLPLIKDVLDKEAAAADKKLERYKEGCRLKANNKQRQVAKLTMKYQQGLRLMQILRAYGAQLPMNEANAHAHSWIEGAVSFAQLRLMDNSLAEIRLLELEIRQLRTE